MTEEFVQLRVADVDTIKYHFLQRIIWLLSKNNFIYDHEDFMIFSNCILKLRHYFLLVKYSQSSDKHYT